MWNFWHFSILELIWMIKKWKRIVGCTLTWMKKGITVDQLYWSSSFYWTLCSSVHLCVQTFYLDNYISMGYYCTKIEERGIVAWFLFVNRRMVIKKYKQKSDLEFYLVYWNVTIFFVLLHQLVSHFKIIELPHGVSLFKTK